MPESGWKPVDVYQDTCTFVDKDATITTHKSETSSKKIIQKSKEGSDLVFSIMDPSMKGLLLRAVKKVPMEVTIHTRNLKLLRI